MQSKTGLLLPRVFRGNRLLEEYLLAGEKPLFDIQRELEGFLEKLLPFGAPADFLSWLFYALGAEDYLRDDWDEVKKRVVLANLFKLFRTKGTVEGLRLHLRILVDQTLIKANQPPDKSFSGISYSESERLQFEALHPEIRIYPFKHQGKQHSFFVGDFLGDPALDFSVFPSRTDALLRIGDTVELYDPLTGEAKPLNYFHIEKEYVEKKARQVVEIRKKGKAYGIFLSYFAFGKLVDHGAKERFYTVELLRPWKEEIERRIPLSIKPTLSPFRTYYEEEKVRAKAYGLFLRNRYTDRFRDEGGAFIQGYFVRSNAGERIYKRLKLFDPNRIHFRRNINIIRFLGALRLSSIPKCSLEAYVDISSFAPKKLIFFQRFLSGYLLKSGAEGRIQKMLWAGRKAKAAGIKVKIATSLRHPLRSSQILVSGNIKSGDFVMEAI